MEEHFRNNPRLMNTKGSGWKPFNRIKWLHEGRFDELEASRQTTVRSRIATRVRALRASRVAADEPSWRSLGPSNIAGRVLSVAFHPLNSDIVYAGTASGGIWKSIDTGASWVPLGDDLPTLAVGAIALSPRDPDIVVMGTGEPTVAYDGMHGLGILRSVDGGKSWQATNVVDYLYAGRSGYHAIEANPLTGVMIAAGLDGLLRSVDDGATWSLVIDGGNWTDVKWRPESTDSVLAAREYGGVYLSTDAGLTFQPLTNGLPPAADMGGLAKLAWSASDPQHVYAGFCAADSFTVLGIYASNDGGATWELRSIPTYFYGYQGFYNNTILVDPSNPERVYVGGISIAVSTSGGSAWGFAGAGVHVDHHAIVIRPGSGGELWVGTDGGIFRSGDGGVTWQARNAGLITLQLYDLCSAPLDSTVAYGGTQDNGTLRYTGSQHWSEGAAGDGMICNCDPSDPMHMYGEYQFGGHFVSWDGLVTNTDINAGLYGSSRFVTPVDMDPSDPLRLITATQSGIFETTNGGALWSRVGDGSDIVSVSVSPVTPRRIWALERSTGIVRTSSDGGQTWTPYMAAPFGGIGGTKILADPADSMAAFCMYLHHPATPPLLLRTTNGGVTWTDVTGDLGEQSVNTMAIDPAIPTRWFVGTDVGVWLSEDSGIHWRPYGLGLPNVVVRDLEFLGESGELRVATYGRGLWSISTHAQVPGLELTSKSALLEIASGNPSRGETTFRFGARLGNRQDLSVFSVTGRRVARVFSGPADGIVRQLRWNAAALATGIYFVVLRSGSAEVTRKVVLVR